MSYIQGEWRSQGTLFPLVLDDLVPAEHVCRVRRSIVEHPFGTLKYRIFGHPRLLLRGGAGRSDRNRTRIDGL